MFKLYSLRYPVNIAFQGAAAQLSHVFFNSVVYHVLARYSVLFDVHI